VSAAPAAEVLVERRGAVLLVTLNRPQSLNALTRSMELRYLEVLREADADSEVAAVVVTGAGRGFCAGVDMGELALIGGEEEEPPIPPEVRAGPLQLRKPLIAAVNGAAAGMGFVHAMYCDFRFVAETAKLSAIFTRRGLVPEYAISWLLPRIVGVTAALDLLMSGRIVSGRESLEIGLANRVLPSEEVLPAALSYAAEMVEHASPYAMAATKRMLYEQLDQGFDEALAGSFAAMLEALREPDAIEGIASFRESRPPRFAPLGDGTNATTGRSQPKAV
jgi:enoyl-CoA hydratase/carnithine racemase